MPLGGAMGCLQQSLTAMDPHFDPRTYGNTRSRAIDQVRHVSRCVPGARINPEAGGRRPWDKYVARAWPLPSPCAALSAR